MQEPLLSPTTLPIALGIFLLVNLLKRYPPLPSKWVPYLSVLSAAIAVCSAHLIGHDWPGPLSLIGEIAIASTLPIGSHKLLKPIVVKLFGEAFADFILGQADNQKTSKAPLAALAILLSVVVLPGCAALGAVAQVVAPYVVQILADIADAQTKLSQVETAAFLYFKEHPDAQAEKRVAKAISAARQSLETASTAAKATGELTEADYLAAFSGFYKAWDQLEDLLSELGIRQPGGSLRVSPDGTSFDFPQPLCLKHRPAVAP